MTDTSRSTEIISDAGGADRPAVAVRMMILILLFRPRGLMGTRRHMSATPRSLPDAGKAAAMLWPWIVALLVAIVLPWLFYNYHTGRHSGFVVSMLSQMGMMIIFALSYNMLLGQAGLFSFCHAVFFGIGGYCHHAFPQSAGDGDLPVPMELMPLLGGSRGPGARDRVRLHGDQAARHRVCHDHARASAN